MANQYHIVYAKSMHKDLKRLKRYLEAEYYQKVSKKIDTYIENLRYIPRGYKTLYFVRDRSGEYRRVVCRKIYYYL